MFSCKTFGMDAPLRASTRDGIVKWGVLMMVIQDGFVLWLLQGLHTGPEAIELAAVPTYCLALTILSVLLNLPRRVSHFILASCEAEFMRKEELADDAKISMYAAQKIGFKTTSGSPPKERPGSGGKSPPPAKPRPPMPIAPVAPPVANGRTTPPPGPAVPPQSSSGPGASGRGGPPGKKAPMTATPKSTNRGGKGPPGKGGGKAMM